MFFIRLRRSAKWVFLLVAFAFAFSFLFAGVGSGGSTGDIVQQVLGMRGTDAIESAENDVEDHPRKASAWTRLAQLYDGEGRRDEAVRAYNEFLKLKPRDTNGLASLRSLWQTITEERFNEFLLIEQELSITSGPLDPNTDPIQSWLGDDPLRTAYQNLLLAKYQEAQTAYTKAAGSWEKAARRYLKAVPEGGLQTQARLELGRAADSAGHFETAIASYKAFLREAPKGSQDISWVKERVPALQKQIAKG